MNDRKENIENGERSARSASGAPENGKRRFNIIDILIIIAVIALIAAVAVRYDFAGNVTTRTETAKAEISFIISNVRKTSSDYLIEGDTVVWTATGMTIGTLKSISVGDAVRYVERTDGTVAKQYDYDRSDISGVIEASGLFTDDGFMLAGSRYIGAGLEIPVTTDHASMTMTVMGITPVQ